MWDTFFTITNLLAASWFHWFASGLAALLGFLSTQITLFAVYPLFRFHASQAWVRRYFIPLLGLVCACLLAWFVHMSLDAFVGWWTSPIDPHLTIIR